MGWEPSILVYCQNIAAIYPSGQTVAFVRALWPRVTFLVDSPYMRMEKKTTGTTFFSSRFLPPVMQTHRLLFLPPKPFRTFSVYTFDFFSLFLTALTRCCGFRADFSYKVCGLKEAPRANAIINGFFSLRGNSDSYLYSIHGFRRKCRFPDETRYFRAIGDRARAFGCCGVGRPNRVLFLGDKTRDGRGTFVSVGL